MLLSKYDTLSRCCFNLGPESPILILILLDPYIYGFNPYSAGIDFSRQNLTSVDVRF